MKSLTGTIATPDGSLIGGVISFSGLIESIQPSAHSSGDYILPGFVDLQVNGSHGIDVMTATVEDLSALGRHLAREGTTSWMPTAVTAPIDRLARVHTAISSATDISCRGQVADAAAILGMHLEGPFISPECLGAHPPLNLVPRGEAFERVLAMNALRLITLAPELVGALDAIRRLTDRGVVVSAGHTNATLDEANAGIAAGVRMFTHLYNAMRPLNHRDPGIIAAALTDSPAFAAIIPDGVHVHPAMLSLAWRARGNNGMLFVTDKVVLAGTSGIPAETVGRARATIRDGAVRLADGTLAGSIISMLDGMRVMIDKVGASIGDCAVMGATNPARLLGAVDRGRLQNGARADLIVLSRALELKSVFIGGREIV